MSLTAFADSPPVESCRLIPFDSTEVIESRCGSMLRVRGSAPCVNMNILLMPRVYIKCPEYWGIEVVGCLPGGICLPTLKDYDESIPLAGVIGSAGVEVIGSSKSQKIEVAGGCSAAEPLT